MNPWGVFRTKWCISRVTRLFIKLHELYKYRVPPLIVTLNDTHILVGNEATDLWPEANGIDSVRQPLSLARKFVATWFLDVSLTSKGNQCYTQRTPTLPTFGRRTCCTPCTPSYFQNVLLVLNTKVFSPRLFESIGTTMVVSHLWDRCI